MNNEYCYFCGNPAESKEHVPPKCIFPEMKDMQGECYRKNLITVPSCSLHNTKKSHDDEFLMVSVAGIFGNNSIGFRHKLGKVDRAIIRSSKKLLDKVFLQKQTYLYKKTENQFYEVIWGTPDHKRLISCFEKIAYGIHYHHFSNRFIGVTKVLLGYLKHNTGNAINFVEFIKHRASLDLKGKSKYGSNQSVFYYQFTDPDEFGLYLLKLVFYGGIEIFISFTPESSSPPKYLAMELMNQGIHTVIYLEDKIYEINKKS